jgi:hypothetical protein
MDKREYDFSKGIRGKHADEYREGTNIPANATTEDAKSTAQDAHQNRKKASTKRSR